MTSPGSDNPPRQFAREDGCPRLDGRFGSLDAFWRLIEPVLTQLRPRRICEIGVEKGIFTTRLLNWGRENECAYVGIDPAPTPAAADSIQAPRTGSAATGSDQLLIARSLDVLPGLERCDVYFLDGDHNYHSVRNELELIQRAANGQAGTVAAPVIFAHDVSWPFARRDMYHQPAAIPTEMRQPYSDDLGVSLAGDELIAGGLRAPGQYSIALRAGGPRNGVLTAVEDFLADEAGQGWQAIVVPIGYGLAILYRPADATLPAPCREYLTNLRASVELTGGFLESCEANFLQLYLYAEHAKHQLEERSLALEFARGTHHETLEAYKALETVHRALAGVHDKLADEYKGLEGGYKALDSQYKALENAYQTTTAHNVDLAQAYDRLQEVHATLEHEYAALLRHSDFLQNYIDCLAPSPITPQSRHGSPRSILGAAPAGDPTKD